jgi:hypothetical protein
MKALGKAVIGGALFLSAFAAAGGAGAVAPTVVSWEQIKGIVVPGTTDTVGGIPGGGQPWTTTSGSAVVDLTNSVMAFKVNGLTLAGGNGIGINPVTSVQGTLVCNPSATTPTIINSKAVPLDPQGNASFIGSISSKSASCTVSGGVAFLITAAPKASPWIAYGAVFSSP